MKLLTFVFSVLVIVGCSSKQVQLDEEKKIIQIKCTFGEDTLDTFNNAFTRVYMDTGIYVIDFNFTIEEQQRIISEINEVSFFDLPDELPSKDFVPYFSGLWAGQYCYVLLNNKSKRISWIDYRSYRDSEEYKRLKSVMNIIYNIVRSRKEVEALPEQVWY